MLSPEGGVALAGLVVLGAAKPRGLNDNSSQFYSSIIVKIFPFCGLEECAMHIDNPQMRGMFFCGVTRHVCRGYDRLWLFGGPPPRAKQTAGVCEVVTNARGAHSPSAITRITFGVMDIECLPPPLKEGVGVGITLSRAQSPNEHRSRSRNVHTTCRH